MTAKSGKYMICLTNYQSEPIELKLKLNSAVGLIIDKEEHSANLTHIENDIFILLNYSRQVNKYMADLRVIATEDNDMYSKTTKKVIIFGLISISIIIVSGIVQVLYLRHFFREKKIA